VVILPQSRPENNLRNTGQLNFERGNTARPAHRPNDESWSLPVFLSADIVWRSDEPWVHLEGPPPIQCRLMSSDSMELVSTTPSTCPIRRAQAIQTSKPSFTGILIQQEQIGIGYFSGHRTRRAFNKAWFGTVRNSANALKTPVHACSLTTGGRPPNRRQSTRNNFP